MCDVVFVFCVSVWDCLKLGIGSQFCRCDVGLRFSTMASWVYLAEMYMSIGPQRSLAGPSLPTDPKP